jgi:pimeloyl-ACP methyl ester carboxylesterase
VDDPDVVRPFQFSVSRGGEAGLSVLELDDVDAKSAATVTVDAPLKVKVELPLQDHEHVLPVGFDGEFFLPLGFGQGGANGVEITIERLPAPLRNARSLTGSIRIFFKKVISERFGTEYKYPLLAAVDTDGRANVRYTFDSQAIRRRVQVARRILLYIHGIIGDTQAMTASAFRLADGVASAIPLMKSRYDLILAFDYENLNTEIERTARDLKQRLADIGLGVGHDKQLHIAAHSMGGLVSRWFIEREAGNRVVQHLVMLGTPNAGSPWPVVEDWVTSLIAIGLNGLARVQWPPTVLGILTRALTKVAAAAADRKEKVEVALGEMDPKSLFLRQLAQSANPGVRYSIIAGNTSLIEEALKAKEGSEGRLKRLLQRLRPQNLLHATTALAFFGVPNDIAASVEAIVAIPPTHTPAPSVTEVACDHLSYFTTEPGLQALAKALN